MSTLLTRLKEDAELFGVAQVTIGEVKELVSTRQALQDLYNHHRSISYSREHREALARAEAALA